VLECHDNPYREKTDDEPQKGKWCKQLGSRDEEKPLHIAVDGLAADDCENVYVYGHTESSLDQQNKGGYDAFIAQYDRAGVQQWVRQMRTVEHDVGTGLDIDAAGHLYVTGYTYGDFARLNQGKADIFIAAYNHQGTLLWKDQIGTTDDDRALDLRLGDHNDVYLCGTTAGSLARQNNDQHISRKIRWYAG
jgi:hypothetical protein